MSVQRTVLAMLAISFLINYNTIQYNTIQLIFDITLLPYACQAQKCTFMPRRRRCNCIPVPLLHHHTSAIITACNRSTTLSPRLDLPGFWLAPKRNEKFSYCGLDLVYRRWISGSPWLGFCGRWEVFGDLHYIILHNAEHCGRRTCSRSPCGG